MVKKIFDISPPREFKKKRELLLVKRPKFQFSLTDIPGKKGLILFFLILIIVGATLHFRLAKAEIEIWPATEIKTLKIKITAEVNQEEIELENKIIPAKIFEAEKIVSEEFPASGKKLVEKVAEGVIRVYNNYHSAQPLVRYTRFQPPLEKVLYFCTKEAIVIPAKSERDVEVFACKEGGRYAPAVGEEYNIKPSTFAVPGLAGTPQYTFVYGKSLESMKGGVKKEVSVVSPEDLKKAEEFLKEKATKETTEVLKAKIPTAEFIVLEEAIKTEILEALPLVQAGAELEKFIFQVKAVAKTISFKKGDLENFSKEFIVSNIPADKKIDQKSLRLDYWPETINLKSGKIVLPLNLETKIYHQIDEASLRKALLGKSLAEIQFFLQNQPEINRAKARLFPFWLKTVPANPEKVEIKLNLD